jgi:hypothetical protein
MSIEAFHIAGKRLRGRAIKVRELTATEIEALDRQSAGIAKSDPDPMTAYQTIRVRDGIRQMIVAITEPLPVGTDLASPDIAWIPTTQADFETKADMAISKLFGARDVVVLGRIFSDLHDVSYAEVSSIMGKAVSL